MIITHIWLRLDFSSHLVGNLNKNHPNLVETSV